MQETCNFDVLYACAAIQCPLLDPTGVNIALLSSAFAVPAQVPHLVRRLHDRTFRLPLAPLGMQKPRTLGGSPPVDAAGMPKSKRTKVAPNIYKVGPSYFVYARVNKKVTCSKAFNSLSEATKSLQELQASRETQRIREKVPNATGSTAVALLVRKAIMRVKEMAASRRRNGPIRRPNSMKSWVEPNIYKVRNSFHVYMSINGKMTASKALPSIDDARKEMVIMRKEQLRKANVRSELLWNARSIGSTKLVCKQNLAKAAKRIRLRFDGKRVSKLVQARMATLAIKMGLINRPAPVVLMMGCDATTLSNHIFNQIKTYDSLFDIAVDHIFPVSMFDISKIENQRKVNNYTNLQPLSTAENTKKGTKLPTKAMAAKVDPRCWPDGVTMDMLPDIYPGWATPLRMHSSGGASCSTDPQ